MRGFSRVDMDAVAPLMPANKTAALVASKGEHFEFSNDKWHVHSATPLPLRAVSPRERGQEHFVDLTGKVIGRLAVQGIADIATGNGTNWSVRCRCGNYETRKAKFIKECLSGNNPGNEEPMCAWCGKTRKLQRGIGVTEKPKVTE